MAPVVRTRVVQWVGGLLALGAVACTGTVGDGSAGQGQGGEGGGNGGDTGGTGTPAAGSGGSGPPPPECSGAAADAVGPAPLRRLSPSEYRNSVKDLFRLATVPTFDIPGDQVVKTFGFDNNAEVQAPVAVLLEKYATAATAVTTTAFQSPDKFMPCMPKSASENQSCGAQFVEKFGQRAFRRPLTSDEKKSFTDFFNSVVANDSFNVAAQLTAQAMLQSPGFLYKLETGSGQASKGAVALSPWELATRLSYLLWNSMPDDDLFASAASGKLTQAAELETQAKRMLKDARAQGALEQFHSQWLGYGVLSTLAKDKATYPMWSDDLKKGLQAEAMHAVELVTKGDSGSYKNLLSSKRSFVNGALADLYKVPRPANPDGDWVDLDSKTRSGFVTQAWWLAGLSHQILPGSIPRGVYVLTRLLCSPTGSAPGNVNTALPDKPTDAKTNRDQIEKIHAASGSCKSCHQLIDGIGFGFEAYDAVGAYRTQDNGEPINDTGSVLVDSDVDGSFKGGVELATKLASSKKVEACIATQWFRFGMGRPEDATADACTLAKISQDFGASGMKLDALLLSMVKSPTFRSRPAFTP